MFCPGRAVVWCFVSTADMVSGPQVQPVVLRCRSIQLTHDTGSARLDERPVAQVQRVKALHHVLQSELEAWPVSCVFGGPQRLCCGAQPGQ